MSTDAEGPPRVLFVTGRLAETALRRVLDDLGPAANLRPEVAVLPISVAALMTPKWVARHLDVPPGVARVVLPGHCRGDLAAVEARAGVPVSLGPEDLRDLPRTLTGKAAGPPADYGRYDVEILAEINHAPRLSLDEFLRQARRFRDEGADRIDVGCDPGGPWLGVGDFVRALRDEGMRASVDSFDPAEVEAAVSAGADLVLSVNTGNRERAADWGVEVVALPDTPGTLDGLDQTAEWLEQKGIPFRLDPILEPIGFGFAASLARYVEARRLWPDAELMMGIGNLTELTDADSAGINTMLLGFCQEVGVRSVLTTAVIPWAASSVREVDLARRLAFHAVTHKTLPKHVEPRLVMLRGRRPHQFGPEALAEMAAKVKDPNWRIYAEDGQIIAFNRDHFLAGTDPTVVFQAMGVDDPSHAFYLGLELMKAKTALTLGKGYRQDEALDWGFLTEPEVSHRPTRIRPADLDAENAS